MTEPAGDRVLPFDAFLNLLRDKGYAVGLHEHLALARLLERWDGTSGPEFRDALAALIARTDEEVLAIRRLFEEVFAPPPPLPPRPMPPPPDPWKAVRTHGWWLAAAAAIIVFAAAMWFSFARPSMTPAAAVVNRTLPDAASPSIARPVDAPPPPAPEPPAPPRPLERRVAISLGSGLFLVALAGFWALKARDARRAWLRRAWSSALAALPGPYHFPLVLRDPIARLPRIDVEDAATIMGRAITNDLHARQLDVRRAVRRTVRNGLMPSFVFKPRRAMHTILVIQDISEDMKLWRSKVDLFLTDLRRQGIPLERYYFNADVRRISDAPNRVTTDLEVVFRRRPNSPVLIVSNGSGLAATFEAERAAESNLASSWLRGLGARERRSWLTPVSDPALWPAELDELPLRSWPMTRRGLAQAARDLVGADSQLPDGVRARILGEGRVSLDGLERMKRLASLVPYPTTDLVELLRRRFAPDVPDAVALHLLHDAGRIGAPVVRLSEEEIARCLAAVRFETPRLEAQVRQTLLRILAESEPAVGSAAHVRWEIADAVHRTALADLGIGDRAVAQATVDALSGGPMWEEMRTMMRLTPTVRSRDRAAGSTLSRLEVPTMGGQTNGAEGTPPKDPPAWADRMPWTWPGVRELAPAALAALLVFVVGWRIGVLPVRALAHIQDAYRLEFVAGTPPALGAAPEGGVLQLDRESSPAIAVPTTVDLYRESDLYQSGIDVSGGPASITLTSGDIGKHYQVRARLPEGNLALSPSVWVPGAGVIVLIDALPWARVTFKGDQVPTGAQTTPFSAVLKPGTYQLQLENGGLTPPLEQPITVSSPGGEGLSLAERTFRFTMPGFDPNRTATELAPTATPGQSAR
ncbi:MAG: hypothetical protein ABMA15_09000 [Vicinamibacterales bacterium]